MSMAPHHSYRALYRSCMKEAAAQGRTLMQRLVRRAAAAMPQRATLSRDQQERKLLADAARTLTKHEGALCEAYPQALLAEFAHAISGDTRKSASLSFDSLELMGDAQMQESVDLMRLQQIVGATVEAEFGELNALVCAVQGLKSAQATRNPLRPEVYVRSLRTVVMQSPVPPAVRSRWMDGLGDALGPELARVYDELSGLLRSQGVAAAAFHVIPLPETSAPAQGALAPGGTTFQANTLLNVRELRRLLSGELDEPAGAASGLEGPRADFSVTVPAAFEALQEMKQVDQVVKRLQERKPAGPQHAQGQLVARRLGQALGQEVVNLMVGNIANDPRLLAPVQQTVRELEPALLRLALSDPRFFSDRKHPARRLLEQMTQRSLAWQSVDAPGFAGFLESLQQAVDALLSTQVDGAEPFEFALKSLEEAWGDQQRLDRRHREQAVRALLKAEQRNLLAEKLGREMRARADIMAAPREIGAFIVGPWSQVMAQARLSDESGAEDPGGFAAVVADLLWSAQPRVAAANSGRMAKLVPELEEKLRHGLATIDYPQPPTQRFLDHLAAAHREAMKSSALPGRPVALSTSMTREELEAMFGGDEEDGPGPWLAPTEAQHSGFMQTHQTVVPKPLFQATQPGSEETRAHAADLQAAVPDTAVRPGAWVEMLMDGGWSRYQVTWASPHATLFMFADATGKTHSMTRRLLDKMLRSDTLRSISGQPVVDVALDAVAQTALRNSVDIKI
jgi:hypothetical protein